MSSMQPSKLLILDLDETLVHAADATLEREPDFTAGPYSLYKRPGLDAFLQAMTTRFRLAVWTSSSRSYAECVCENIFPEEMHLDFIWARDRCTPRFQPELQDFEWTKNLGKLKRKGYRLEHVIMLDDTPAKLARHYGNLVRVKPFFGDLSDRELFDLTGYLSKLGDAVNIRAIEKRNWRSSIQLPPHTAD